jgi:hypothetical protein
MTAAGLRSEPRGPGGHNWAEWLTSCPACAIIEPVATNSDGARDDASPEEEQP